VKFTQKMKNIKLSDFFLLCALFLLRLHKINCGALELNSDNWHDTLKNNKIVLINFITADGTTFSSPLKHIGKTVEDMPIICLDSFRHMYLFKRFSDVDVPGKLRRFIEDLHSGRLHFEFHNPPAEGIEEVVQEIPVENTISSTAPPESEKIVPDDVSEKKVDVEVTKETHEDESKPPPAKDDKGDDNDGDDDDEDDENTLDAKQESGSGKVSPPETVFWKLGPSESRYTLLHWRDYAGNFRDEL